MATMNSDKNVMPTGRPLHVDTKTFYLREIGTTYKKPGSGNEPAPSLLNGLFRTAPVPSPSNPVARTILEVQINADAGSVWGLRFDLKIDSIFASQANQLSIPGINPRMCQLSLWDPTTETYKTTFHGTPNLATPIGLSISGIGVDHENSGTKPKVKRVTFQASLCDETGRTVRVIMTNKEEAFLPNTYLIGINVELNQPSTKPTEPFPFRISAKRLVLFDFELGLWKSEKQVNEQRNLIKEPREEGWVEKLSKVTLGLPYAIDKWDAAPEPKEAEQVR